MMCVPRAATVQIRLLGEMCLAAIATAQLSSISQIVHTCDYCYTAANLYHSGTFAQGAQEGRAAAQPLSFTARAMIPAVPTTEINARDRHQLVTSLKACKYHEEVLACYTLCLSLKLYMKVQKGGASARAIYK